MKNAISKFIASGFYSGYSGRAPGTIGSLALFIILNISHAIGLNFTLSIICLFAVIVFALGIITINILLDRHLKTYHEIIDDPQFVVIDEWAGLLVTLTAYHYSNYNFFISSLIALIFFRIFDITKPYPIKRVENISGSWGIMLDDVIAGIYGAISSLIIFNMF
jgi:phosphatidylglycerophosphatase A